MKDGTLYRIDGGRVSWIRDSNGNRISFTYEVAGTSSFYRLIGITDSLNRVISISYANGNYDEISFKGFGQAQRSIKVWHSPMVNLLRPDFTIKKANQLFPEVYAMQQFWTGDWDHNPTLVSQVELPDHRLYQFRYNAYGEVVRIILPTGGGFDYEYGYPWGGSGAGSGSLMVYRRLTKRTVFNVLTPTTDPVNPPAGTREKIEAYVVESPYAETPTVIRVEQRDSDNVLKAQSKHYFFGFPEEDSSCTPIHYSWWPSGNMFKTEIFNVSGGVADAVLRMTEQVWSPAIPPRGLCYTSPPPNPKIVEIVTTLADTNQVA
ncbi:MAG: hypothetical protein L0220_11080, partial [Acidobacteria bacterium]|nr:hypothetical protein [Acidobacteriota bacterium]